ncbi:MAG: gamma-glutamyl-gamma-aminobutyrate hydrolase family protein [Chloroflexi bacterium]|nr:gamma-glutamyl-gamma-aminobutyrate hydrolase family protein [Chloroflexota bacterium]
MNQDRPRRAPRIVVTVADAAADPDPALRASRNALYADGVLRHGGMPLLLSVATPPDERVALLAVMDGLLLSGGADLDPATYGRLAAGARAAAPGRDELERAAWGAAEARGVPVLGICRGLQAMNVFAGGVLLQHVDGHAGPALGEGPALVHPLQLVPSTPTTTRPCGQTTWPRVSWLRPSPTRRPGRWLRRWRHRGRASWSASSATRNVSSRHRRPSGGCGRHSWLPAGSDRRRAEPVRPNAWPPGPQVTARPEAGPPARGATTRAGRPP